MPRYKIKDHERGHRPPLSEEEPTEQYSIKLIRSTRKRLREAGSDRVRTLLNSFARSKENADD